MKAKLYFNKLKECPNEEAFMEFYESMMYDLVKETEELIKTRNARKNESIKSCVLEVDNKYKAIIRLLNKYKEELIKELDCDPDKEFLKTLTFLDDGFKAIYVELHPEHKWVFDLDKHKKMVKEMQEENERKQKRRENFFLHKVTPFEDLTMNNIHTELFACLTSLANFSHMIEDTGMTLECAKPLAYRITLLKWWIHKGEINLEEAKEWEVNKEKWCQDHLV